MGRRRVRRWAVSQGSIRLCRDTRGSSLWLQDRCLGGQCGSTFVILLAELSSEMRNASWSEEFDIRMPRRCYFRTTATSSIGPDAHTARFGNRRGQLQAQRLGISKSYLHLRWLGSILRRALTRQKLLSRASAPPLQQLLQLLRLGPHLQCQQRLDRLLRRHRRRRPAYRRRQFHRHRD